MLPCPRAEDRRTPTQRRQASKGPRQGSEGRVEKDDSGKRWETQNPALGEPRLLAWGVQPEPINLPSPGRVRGLWCRVWTLITRLLNPLPYCENIFADLKYRGLGLSAALPGGARKTADRADPTGKSTLPSPPPTLPAPEACPGSLVQGIGTLASWKRGPASSLSLPRMSAVTSPGPSQGGGGQGGLQPGFGGGGAGLGEVRGCAGHVRQESSPSSPLGTRGCREPSARSFFLLNKMDWKTNWLK